MPRIPIPFVGPSFQDLSLDMNAQESWNWYVRPAGTGGKGPALVETPGLLFQTQLPVGGGTIRGILPATVGAQEFVFVVAGNRVFQVSEGMEITDRGTLQTSTGAVDLHWNGYQLLVVESLPRSNSSRAYVYDSTIIQGRDNAFIDLMATRVLAFTTGSAEYVRGDEVAGDSSGATAYVYRVEVTSGTWGGGTAAGFLYLHSQAGAFQAENISGGGAAAIGGNSADDGLGFGVTKGGYISGRFLLNENNSGRFWWSEPGDGTYWLGSNVASAEVASDNLLSLLVSGGVVWLFGEDSTEVWTPSSDSEAPFVRASGAAIPYGIAAPLSVEMLGGSPVWLARNPRGKGHVVAARGYSSAEPISTPALSAFISRVRDVSTARAWVRDQDGLEFYTLSIPSAGRSLIFCPNGGWADIGYWNTTTGKFEHHLGACGAYCHVWDKFIVGSRLDTRLYSLDPETPTDNGEIVRRMRKTQPLHADGKRMFWHSLEVDFETGVGVGTGVGKNPVALLSWSDDGGHTWSSEYPEPIGPVGRRGVRVKWSRLGSSYERVYRLVVAEPVKARVLGAWAEITTEDG